MESKEITYFTETETTAIQIIRDLGFGRSFARVLVFLLSHPDSTIRDIERGADLRQSDVSLATAELLKRRWISCRSVPGEAKRRPVKVFHREMTVAEIISCIEKEKRREAAATQVRIEKLKSLVHGYTTSPGNPPDRSNNDRSVRGPAAEKIPGEHHCVTGREKGSG